MTKNLSRIFLLPESYSLFYAESAQDYYDKSQQKIQTRNNKYGRNYETIRRYGAR